MNAECAVEQFRDVVIFVASAGDVSDDAWGRYVKHASRPDIRFNLVIALGQLGITSKQRKTMADVARVRGIDTAAVTDSRIVRGMITAVSWVGVRIDSFSLGSLANAVAAVRDGDEDKQRQLQEHVSALIDEVQCSARKTSRAPVA